MTFAFITMLFAQANAFPLGQMDVSAVEQEWGNPAKNKSVDGRPLTIGSETYSTGLGTHANSSFSIALGKKGVRFKASVGVDAEVGSQGSISFQVWGDKRRLFDSGLMKGGQAAKLVDVDLSGVEKLKLIVTDGGDNINYDHGDWADAVIEMAPGAQPKAVKVPVEPPIAIARTVPARPWIHGARVIGCSPGKPFLFLVPASGQRPFKYLVTKGTLPKGIALDKSTGVIAGSVAEKGVSKFTIGVIGAKGKDAREYTLRAEGKLALTPTLGWNSWNVWGTHVDADKVRAAADAFMKEKLSDFGYSYINIDDAWEKNRDASGKIVTNDRFPDMGNLADYVHSFGLKLGIYSSPGPYTCGGYTGSFDHEKQDAESYANWGIDYLKYDWCSYGDIAKSPDLAAMKKPYSLMYDYLKGSKRDIVYSLCQYGMGDVYKWGGEVGGNLWRTTGDITDTWQSMSSIGFDHSKRSPFVKPGGWNDPDMLVVGQLGWGPSPRPTRLTPNEQITHITLWSMLAAPFLIGCDLTHVDAFTKAILCNHEVIEIDQDPLGKAATRKWQSKNGLEVWARPLWDGSTAVALFNRSSERETVTATWKDLGLKGSHKVMDCWQMKWVGMKSGSVSAVVPAHGAMLFKVAK